MFSTDRNPKTKLSSEFDDDYSNTSKLMNECPAAIAIVYALNYGMAAGGCFIQWRRAQWSTALRRLPGHFAISATSVECYGLSRVFAYNSSNGTTRVWIGSLYQVKPTKYHGVRTLSFIVKLSSHQVAIHELKCRGRYIIIITSSGSVASPMSCLHCLIVTEIDTVTELIS